ncbi:hypothetical protein ARMGADRAFT_1018146 [Armillaria gallica]|uniref:Uncharacterized protein n=1 Tax=Armillaria gallica TaxID=47427 RepID=A0A2H3CIK9_ARMGA|nr:hypothetical protein ARMGADRAFT_1020444 [Armillaria gallica]PBK85097.1 hypothetical protein ARMGADRAFT_1018146 [Armillaria gallica]
MYSKLNRARLSDSTTILVSSFCRILHVSLHLLLKIDMLMCRLCDPSPSIVQVEEQPALTMHDRGNRRAMEFEE